MAEKVKCDICEGTFKDHDGLEKHKAAKHPQAIKKEHTSSGSSNAKYIAYAVVAIILIASGYAMFNGDGAVGQYDGFAKCLDDAGAKFYGAFWCPHCAEQKEMFGSSAKYLNYIECSTPDRRAQLAVCTSAGVESYPTWIFADGTKKGGVLSFNELSIQTGCSINAVQ